MRTKLKIAAVSLILPAAGWLVARNAAPPPFAKTQTLITMRDGVRLHTEINVPANAREPLPILLLRTPYGAAGRSAALGSGGYSELAADGYIFAFQDIRGRYESEGTFVMLRPPRDSSEPRAADESTDAWDTIEWLVKNVRNNNGRVGVFGISYPGWLTVMAGLEPHPALKAISEQASPADMFLGDDFYHNGAFRLTYGFEYAWQMENAATNSLFPFRRYDEFEWYLNLVPLSSANAFHFHGKLPTWNAFEQHPDYDEFWKSIAVPRYLGAPAVPELNVAGWWDQEDFYGPQTIYAALERQDSARRNYFVAGPWNHGGWASGDGRALGAIDFGSATAKYFREEIEAPWFAYWLKGKGDGKFPEARVFQTGSNRWESYDAWPPRDGVRTRSVYLGPDGRLAFEAPGEQDGFDSYVSDPAHPVPYRRRPIGPTYGRPGWATWLVEDQRFVHLRPDVLSWESEPLSEDLTVAGEILAHIFASTSGSDADWIVKLIDLYPEDYRADEKMSGYQLMVANEIFRGRFREGFDHARPLKPGAVEEYSISLHTSDHAFLKGHRLMVQVQSTWFPLYNRNPQTFVPNILKAGAADYRAETHRVYRTRAYPSRIELPVVGVR